MKKNAALTLVLSLILGLKLNAQIETYNLSLFKLPYIKRHSLDLNFETINDINFQNYKDISSYNYKRSAISSMGSASGTYGYYLNTPKTQLNTYLNSSFNTQLNMNNQNFNETQKKYNSNFPNSLSVSFNTGLRNYFSDKLFFEFNPSADFYSWNYNHSEITKDSNNEITREYSYKTRDLRSSVRTSAGIGYGRIEFVSDAQVALFILSDLKKENKLTREPSHQEITALAELITIKKNQRIFDSR